MTVWDSMALNAPHTEREIRSIHETGAGDLPTKLDGFPLLEEAIKEHFGQRCDEYMAGCPCCDTWAELDRLRAIRAATARELAQDGELSPGSTTEPENATCPSTGGFGASAFDAGRVKGWEEAAQFAESFKPADYGTGEPVEVEPEVLMQCLVAGIRVLAGKLAATLAAGKEVMPDAAPISRGFPTPATSPGVTAGAVLSAIAAEKAEWPHNGVMHDAARTACDAIAERVKKLMGVA